LKPKFVVPLVLYLCHEKSNVNGHVFEVGADRVSNIRQQRSKGLISKDLKINTSNFTDPNYSNSIQNSLPKIKEHIKSSELVINPTSSKKGNENVDLDKAIGHQFSSTKSIYTEKDVALYALAIGEARDPLDKKQLQFVYENSPSFRTIPTIGVTFPFSVLGQVMETPGLNFNPMMLLHGEHYLEIIKTIPTSGTLISTGKVSNIYDKGKGSLLIIDSITKNEQGEEICFNQFSLFIRGIGGFGGDRGPTGESNNPPNRPPDAISSEKTNQNQALFYRLVSGDLNPLHADPEMASIGGFDRPILHGLCSFGHAGRAVIKHFCNYETERFKSIRVRFSKNVFPGETIITEMWKVSETKIIFQCKVEERPNVGLVLSNCCVELKPSGVKLASNL